VNPSRWGDANESGGHTTLPPTGEAALLGLAAQSPRQVNLNYPADVRDSAKSGLGLKGNHRLNDPAESTHMNRRGHPETEGQQSAGETGVASEPS
jgi:hypothetical protein